MGWFGSMVTIEKFSNKFSKLNLNRLKSVRNLYETDTFVIKIYFKIQNRIRWSFWKSHTVLKKMLLKVFTWFIHIMRQTIHWNLAFDNAFISKFILLTIKFHIQCMDVGCLCFPWYHRMISKRFGLQTLLTQFAWDIKSTEGILHHKNHFPKIFDTIFSFFSTKIVFSLHFPCSYIATAHFECWISNALSYVNFVITFILCTNRQIVNKRI